MLYQAGISDRTRVPEAKVQQLMGYHGTGVLKITQDEVYVFRGSVWIPVLERAQG